MPDQNTTNPAAASAPTVSDYGTPIQSDVIVDPNTPDITETAPAASVPSIYTQVINKISDAHNVLIALSGDPSVDEMAAAIGLSLYLDKLGKRATAIYSGQTPNALEFLKPEETFEPTVDALQDFVIALSKEKADHLRYKLDGDYVKIFITPYRTRISEDDLDFSYGDFNVDLVLALDVANGIDLDSALREHGRIMHDAVIINITTGNPGKFGEIEWSDKTASSISEMIAKLLLSVNTGTDLGKEEATAFLTGVVAATNRFSNAATTPETMQISSRLMRCGANQQLISKNITPDVDNEILSFASSPAKESKSKSKHDEDPTKLDIEHSNEEDTGKSKEDDKPEESKDDDKPEESKDDDKSDETKEVSDTITEKESTLLDDLKAAEASLSQTGAETTPDTSGQPIKLDDLSDSKSDSISPDDTKLSSDEPSLPPVSEPLTPSLDTSTLPSSDTLSSTEEKNIQPSYGFDTGAPSQDSLGSDISSPDTASQEPNVYGKMLEDALNDSTDSSSSSPSSPFVSNPAMSSAPEVATSPEINGVPEMSYVPMPDETILPPPPAPPIDMSSPGLSMDPSMPIAPASPVPTPTPQPLGAQPSMQDQVYNPQASDPGAFKIPGM